MSGREKNGKKVENFRVPLLIYSVFYFYFCTDESRKGITYHPGHVDHTLH